MRWDQWLLALFFNGLQGVVLGAAAFFLDGMLTRTEWVMIAGAFIGGMAMYMKSHPPSEISWAAVAQQQVKVAAKVAEVAQQQEKLVTMTQAATAKDCPPSEEKR